ncbi:helix-turn-helix domain-containing protein [Symbioplanes lichenis]|uniref:helix-turn-helix domain-containing protein n=1 Tax=Symbioplanes lichenis TaxID=1629072 RepID=UPI0027397904|nr:helix-turn-helix transcriptional regulator [Actinoplanes lichenis]
MSRPSSPTARRSELGALLKRYREERGLTATEVAADVGVDVSTISRLENAQRSPKELLVRALSNRYGLDAATTEDLVRMTREGRRRGWWERYDLETSTATLVGLESAATEIAGFETTVIPGLLQTEAYAKEVIRPVRLDFSADRLAQAVESRMGRQQILSGDSALHLHIVIDEAVLHRVVGDHDVMRDQLAHLGAMAGRPNIRVQVLPFTAGASPGLDGSFSLLSFVGGGSLPPVVYTEGQLGQLFERRPEEVARCRQAFVLLTELALDPAQSIETIDRCLHNIPA